MRRVSRKRDPEFMDLVLKHVAVDDNTGKLTLNGIYGNLVINFGWKNGVIPVPYSHIVWLLNYGRWPKEGYHLHHINEDPIDNRVDNLEELTEPENQKRRRGRMVYRSYGTGKYGYGINLHHDKRDGRFYVRRHLSRGHGSGDLKGIDKSLGGFDTRAAAEARIKEVIAEIKARGLAYLPEVVTKNPKKQTAEMNAAIEEMRKLRAQGYSVKAIAEMLNFDTIAVYNRIKDMGIDNRRGAAHGGVKLNEEKVREIRKRAAAGETQIKLAQEFEVSSAMISQIVKRQAWGHVT